MHTSFQTVPVRAFRQPHVAATGSFTRAAWRAPAVRPPHSRHRAQSTFRMLRIPRPAHLEEPRRWIERLEPFLPPHLTSLLSVRPNIPSPDNDKERLARDICAFLARSEKHSSVDILSYLGAEQGRWGAVMWIVKTVVELKIEDRGGIEDIGPFSYIQWPDTPISLKEATNQPIVAERMSSAAPVRHSLKQLFKWKELFSKEGLHFRKTALGRIWKSLGNMVLIAVGDRSKAASSIMPHVLELIAYLHHAGLISESVYHYDPPKAAFAPQQSPMLHLLSSRILTALSDATWRAHESAVASATKSQAQHTFLGHEIPGSRYKVHIPELGPEVWLELVLWSCLHGGWIDEGVAILERLAMYEGDQRWSVFNWRKALENQLGESPPREMTWRDMLSFNNARGTQPNSPERLLVKQTISSEVVAAFVDGLVNEVRATCIGGEAEVEDILSRVVTLKSFLNRKGFGLGLTSWEATVVRFMETAGFDAKKEPRLIEKTLNLVPAYGKESEYTNAPHEGAGFVGAPSYILDASAATIGILHRTLRAHALKGDVGEAFKTVERLQQLTDDNKRRSMQQFFRKLNSSSEDDLSPLESFDNDLSRHDLPALLPQIPTALLASVLRLATKSGAHGFARSLLHSEDIDGPLITEEMYSHSIMAAELIRYGKETGDGPLISKVVSLLSRSSMPIRVLEALLHSQMQDDQWESAENVIGAIAECGDPGRISRLASRLARYMLILQPRGENAAGFDGDHPFVKAASIFQKLVRGEYGPREPETLNRFHGVMCVLASMGPEWREFCSSLWIYRGARPLEDSVWTKDLAEILEGVTQSRGSIEGRRLLSKWCRNVTKVRNIKRVFTRTMDPERELFPPAEIFVARSDAAPISLRGHRLWPSIGLLRIIYRKALQEVADGSVVESESVDLLAWAAVGLRALGLEDDDIDHELDGMVSRGRVGLPLANAVEPQASKQVDERDADEE